jgi:glycosyltransferase involved in cell wall biosynthesis
VRISSGLGEAELAERYHAAGAFLCLSEHEGFCLPLLEAFRAGVPVVAKPAGAVEEVAADAALLVDDDDSAVVAELLHLVLSDRQLRHELVRRGRERAAAFEPARVEPALRAAVERTAGAA